MSAEIPFEIIEETSPVLVLPSDQDRLNQLQRKLTEYRGRLDNERRLDPYRPPETFGTYFKIDILEKLMEERKVVAWDYCMDIAQSAGMGQEQIDMAANALGVIDDYIQTGGVNNRGGTGLR